jgi:hypothetical protein
MDLLARKYGAQVYTANILLKRFEDESGAKFAESVLPINTVKTTFGIALHPVVHRNVMVIEEMGALYDQSPEEFEKILQQLGATSTKASATSATIDLLKTKVKKTETPIAKPVSAPVVDLPELPAEESTAPAASGTLPPDDELIAAMTDECERETVLMLDEFLDHYPSIPRDQLEPKVIALMQANLQYDPHGRMCVKPIH